MITFFPGPSQVFPETGHWLRQAFEEGILSISHRSEAFNKLSEDTISKIRKRLQIPNDYTIFYTTSATECWEIISQSLVGKSTRHYYNGSFGEKWFQYAANIRSHSQGVAFGINDVLEPANLFAEPDEEIICLTQNETSNGTQIRPEVIGAIKAHYPNKLLAIDATSSVNGIYLPFEEADIWFGSVQKCFGLPAGLGLLICSPAAIARALEINNHQYYNSLPVLIGHIKKFQTSHTPNVLGIYLLNKVLSYSLPILETNNEIVNRAKVYYEFLDNSEKLKPLVTNPLTRSDTVVTVQAQPAVISQIKEEAKAKGILLGSGYGQWKESTFRIANFPALQQEDVDKLLTFLKAF